MLLQIEVIMNTAMRELIGGNIQIEMMLGMKES
jgi:hypothetical protein